MGCKELILNHLALNINYYPGDEPRSPAEEAQAAARGWGLGGAMGGRGPASRTQLAAQLIKYGTASSLGRPTRAAPGRPLRACAPPPSLFF